ncbi:MAG: protein kinase [Planctomycetota bacterium]|nr:protein kinase [Planctomycetota bacterium]
MGILYTTNQFLEFALQRALLTKENAQRCKAQCLKSGRSVTEVAVALDLLKPDQVEELVRAIRRAPSVRPAMPADTLVSLQKELAPLIEEAEIGKGRMLNRRYRIVDLLGEGGMGRVYLVADTLSGGKEMALKTLRRGVPATNHPDERPEKEFKILAGLRHPNLEAVYDYGRIEEGPEDQQGCFFFSCELLKGTDMLIASEELTWERIVPLIVQLCRGLQFIHARELIHFDLKPENVLVCEDSVVKLVDFGVARRRQPGRELPFLMGTIPYISPEMLRREPADHRADLYALGVTMYELFTRELPYDDPNPVRVIESHLNAPIPHIRAKVPSLPQGLEDLITRLMAKHPAQRPASANEVIRTLGRIVGTEYELETKETLKGYVGSGGFVGREDELNWLKQLWSAAQKNEKGPRIAIVSGEAGIGKSRLAREFRIWAQVQQAAVAEAKANEGIAEPFGLAREALEKIIRQTEVWEHTGHTQAGLIRAYAPYLKSVIPAVGDWFQAEDPPKLDAQQESLRLLDKLAEFVLKGAKTDGLIILLDDAQWADEMSLKFIESLGRKAGLGAEGGKVVIVVTVREDEEPEALRKLLKRLMADGCAQERILRALSKTQQEQFVRTMFGEGANVLGEKILSVEMSGNPLFLEEVLREWVDDKVLQWRAWGWEVDRERWKEASLPGGVRDAIARRLRKLADAERDWLQRLAMWGKAVTEDEMSLLSRLETRPRRKGHSQSSVRRTVRIHQTGEELANLLSRGLLRQEATADAVAYRFAHDRIREMITKDMTVETRRKLNLELLGRLEAAIASGRRKERDEIDRLARLAWEGGAKDKYARYGESAAENAVNRYAPAEARDAFRRLLEVGLPPEKEIRVLTQVGDLCGTLGNVAEMVSAYSEALVRIAALSADPAAPGLSERLLNAAAQLEQKRARALSRLGRIAEAEQGFKRAVQLQEDRVLAPAEALEYARTLHQYGWFLADFKFQVEEGEELVRKGIELAQAQGPCGEETMCDGRVRLGGIAAVRGDIATALEHCRAQLDFYERTGQKWGLAKALNNVGHMLAGLQDLSAAVKVLQRGLKVSEEIGYRWGMTLVLQNLGQAYRYKGELDRSIQCQEQALAIAEEMGDAQMIAGGAHELALSCREQGDVNRALELNLRAARICEEIGDKRGLGRALCNIGNTYLEIGELAQAIETYSRYLALSDSIGDKVAHRLSRYASAAALIEKGELDRALELWQEGQAGASGPASRHQQNSALTVSALLQLARKDYQKAHAACDQGISAAREVGTGLVEVEFVQIKLSILRRQGRHKEGLFLARDALRLADELNASGAIRGALNAEMCRSAAELGDREAATQALSQAERLIGGAIFRVKLDLELARARCAMAFGDREAARGLYKEIIGSLREKGFVYRVDEIEEELRRVTGEGRE